jgi:uncharacterized protein
VSATERKRHCFSSDEARAAGKKGGKKTARDRTHMSEIGRRGGEASGRTRKQRSRRRQKRKS